MGINILMQHENFPTKVKIVEVGPRDGLQNETKIVPTAIKIDFINQLSHTGLSVIEATSFVSPKWIPQLSDHAEVFQTINKLSHIHYPVFVPNMSGFQHALAAGVNEIAVFTTPSELFCKRNINKSVAESLLEISKITAEARKHNILVRGYISCVLGCPYQGDIDTYSVVDIAKKLIELGCYEISLGDTIGVGTPLKTRILIQMIKKEIPINQIAVHFHDTYGQAIANIFVALGQGISIIDSAVAGLGGCPYARGATGNVATEDVLYLLHNMEIETGIDLKKMITVGRFITDYLERPIQSKVNRAYIPFTDGF